MHLEACFKPMFQAKGSGNIWSLTVPGPAEAHAESMVKLLARHPVRAQSKHSCLVLHASNQMACGRDLGPDGRLFSEKPPTALIFRELQKILHLRILSTWYTAQHPNRK